MNWDGERISWTWDGAERWHPLTTAQFPGLAKQFDAVAPAPTQGFSPPFLSVLQEPGHLQIWSGLVCRTAPDWSLLLRAPANVPRQSGFELFEGIIESDRWFGPLFSAMRLTRTDTVVEFRADWPLFQVQPLPRSLYSDDTLGRYRVVSDMTGLSREDWTDFHTTVVRPNIEPDRRRGDYAVAARKRRRTGERRPPPE